MHLYYSQATFIFESDLSFFFEFSISTEQCCVLARPADYYNGRFAEAVRVVEDYAWPYSSAPRREVVGTVTYLRLRYFVFGHRLRV